MTAKKQDEWHLGQALTPEQDPTFHVYEFPSDDEVRKENEAAAGGKPSGGEAGERNPK